MKILCLAVLLAATPALARVKLVDADPAPRARVKTPGVIRLHFSEPLAPADSGAELIDAKGVRVPVSRSVGGATISLLPLALKPGVYTVTWHGMGADRRPAKGKTAFTVIP